jgi:hypothetical protein
MSAQVQLQKQDLVRFKLEQLDPFDHELIERALESAWVAAKGNVPSGELDSDEALEADLRRELIEIALVNGATDAETLRDILEATRSPQEEAGEASTETR